MWIVVVGKGAFASAYGPFQNYEECVQWLTQNGWHPSEESIYPVREPQR